MKLNSLEKSLQQKLEIQIRDTTPGVMVRAYQGGRLVCDVSVGQTYPYYDLASLTKIIFSVQAMMEAFDQKKWNLESTVADFLPWFKHKEILIKDLLTHSSGLIWWMPLYQKIDLNLDFQSKREQLKKLLNEAPFEKQEKSVYSDIGFLVISYLMEELFQKPLNEVWKEIKQNYYPGTTLEFHEENKTLQRASLYAPTEECSWRGRLIQSEVHDENAWSLGGVSSHAGLFGSIDDLGWFSLHLRSQLLGIARYSIKQKTAQLFSQRAIPEELGDWALGYMMPTPGASSSGNYFSQQSIGHTGFTGTSLWYDPKADLSVAILSNRVLYGRDNKSFNQLRPQIHNWIVEGLRRSSL